MNMPHSPEHDASYLSFCSRNVKSRYLPVSHDSKCLFPCRMLNEQAGNRNSSALILQNLSHSTISILKRFSPHAGASVFQSKLRSVISGIIMPQIGEKNPLSIVHP